MKNPTIPIMALHEVVWVAQVEPARLGVGYRPKAPKWKEIALRKRSLLRKPLLR